MSKVPIPTGPVPQHVAIIMDGNGRWAHARNRPRIAGHKAGAKAVRRVVTYARKAGLRYLTLYAFSSENWRRPENEVSGLMVLLQEYLRSELRTMQKNGIRLNVIGAVDKLPEFVRGPLLETQQKTADLDAMTLTLALSYGGRDELLRAVRKLATQVQQGKIQVNDIDEQAFCKVLDTADLPDPDLLIRTSGENRISNFLLWQIAYTELLILPQAWPEFDEQAMYDAIVDFQHRERRFGKTGAQIKAPVQASKGT